ncbi:DUF2855 family protein [Geodermatophilus maliterrae]|uniref:DUF2855 family protein n=1 Tax=Geodermatophilus maliterrae TaxID=3162531 RepID=A0ABV3XH23_9ACTN
MVDLLVRRDDLRVVRVDAGEPARTDVAAGTVQFAVERFGLTANNLTYAVLGDRWRYWDHFPGPDGWGRVPAWGFGRVAASGVDGVAVGDRFFGFWPMSSRVTLEVAADGGGVVDRSAARASLPAVYTRYLRARPETGFPPEHDDAAAVLRPLFLTGWLLADQLAARDWHGAGAVVLTSASSRTAWCTATAIRARDDAPAVIGLTSAGRVDDTAGLGLYDQVLAYDDVGALPVDRGVVLVDVAGDAAVRAAVHERTQDVLRVSVVVGATHWTRAGDSSGLPGPAPVVFSAPDAAAEGAATSGAAAFARRLGAAWAAFVTDRVPGLLRFEHVTGADALAGAWSALLDGDVDPRRGLVVSL